MIGSRAWRALMRRNLIYRKRNIVGSLLELFLPIIFVGFLVLIKKSFENSASFSPEAIPAQFPGNFEPLVPFSFTDYVTAMQAERKCEIIEVPNWDPDQPVEYDLGITGLPYLGYNWQVPFVKCDSRRCKEDGEDADQYCEYLALGVAPASDSDAAGKEQAEAFKKYIEDRYPELVDNPDLPPSFNFELVKMFESENDVVQYITGSNYESTDVPKLALAVVFDGTDATVNYNYKIRVNSTGFNAPEDEGRPATPTTPPTDKNFATFIKEDDQSCPIIIGGTPEIGPYGTSCTGRYMYNGAITIQRLVNDFIMVDSGAKANGYYVAEHGVKYAPFPSPEYIQNGFYADIAAFAPLLVTLGLLYPVAAMVRYITLEKQLRQKELMKMMSVKESDIGWSWFISFFVFHLFTTVGSTIMSVFLYSNSSPLLLWIFWQFTFTALICFTFFIAALFSKATRATLVGLLIFFVGYFLTLVVDFQEGNSGIISLVSLHPVAAFAFGLQEIGRLEDLGVGLTVDTISQTDSASGYTFGNTLFNFIFDCIFWGILTWYANRVVPSDFGRPLPWYFPCTLSYWCPGSVKAPPSDDNDEIVYDAGVAVEEVSNNLKDQVAEGKTIEIRKLKKVFGEKIAVDGLSMSFYRNQITALLGHNGAGKTTTINMLTGMFAPTEGYATVAGKDIRTEMDGIRQEIGICLQHDCLFPELTVREHVDFFARIKGMHARMSAKEAREKVDGSIQDVALSEKRNTLSKNLSGGMKRKLSVAIAFCGDSKTVLLDEPTSGMDPFARRFTWNVIRQYRQDRCIILTTHFMDEADILGDRIAIMAEGQLRCLGSSLFLKKTYGVGYQLTIEKQPRTSKATPLALTGDGEKGGLVPSADDKLAGIVDGSVPEATLLTNVGTEMSFQLPLGAASSFAPMFEQLDAEIDNGGIVTYGVGVTTLDEVFLLVARGGDANPDKKDYASSGHFAMKDDAEKSVRSRMDLENDGLFVRHVGALFRKRAVNFKRDKKAWCCSTILPTLFVFVGFIIFTFAGLPTSFEPLTLDLDDLNVNVKQEPRNPIPFSSGDMYSCQPGKCIYDVPFVESNVTGESYAYCGLQSYLGPETSCSIENYEPIMARITEAGAKPVGDAVENVTESSYSLADSKQAFAATQYGAIYFTHDLSSQIEGQILNETVSGIRFNDTVVASCINFKGDYLSDEECANYAGIGYVLQYNFTAIHATPLYQTLADEAIVREALNDDDFKIKTVIHPLPQTGFEANLSQAGDAFTAWFLIILSFPFILGSFATFVVAERESKAKHLQTVAGVKPSSYWLSTWLWDVANYQIPMGITIILMFAFGVDVMTTTDRGVLGGVIILFVLFGPAGASFTYCVSFLFSSPSICNLFIIISGFLIGLGGTMASFIMTLIGNDPGNPNDKLVTAANIINWVLRFIPAFNLSRGLFAAINIETLEFLAAEPITVWHDSVMLYEVIFLMWQSVVYLLLAMKIDEWSSNPRAVNIWHGFTSFITCQWICGSSYHIDEDEGIKAPEDDDVLAEQERVHTGGANDDLIVLDKLRKVYDNGKVAVNNMSLGIPPGQCFGLLGINGAGKTTTMQMLTAEFPPTDGDATLAGFSVTREPEKTRRRVGYCPQFDAHFTNMTGREHVELYASIKGVPLSIVKEASASKLAEVGLSELDSDRLSAGYSGGMKRRLSLACATIGQPQILFLDECSTGVDPVARREIWQMISDMVEGGNLPPEEKTSVVLTTHSMEECEALCPRIAIMAGGKMRCVGSAQHLKSKFGQGYQVEMKIKNVAETDGDYLENLNKIASSEGVELPQRTDAEEAGLHLDEIFLTFEQAWHALATLTGDEYLTAMINQDDPTGYLIYREATSPAGVDIDGLTDFATSELRMRKLNEFITKHYPSHVLRERQDTKARYEVSSEGVRIASIFESIEQNKDMLQVAEYGVSQTSLEQVFNMHAAEAEKLKQGTNDA